MSWLAAQRVMVRMHFDADFAGRVYAEPDAALAGTELSAAERAWILRVDPRAWRVDPFMAERALQVIIQEYPASFRTLLAAAGDTLAFRRFFTSSAFHACVQERGSMALAFGDWALELEAQGEINGVGIRSLLCLEREIARLWRGAGRRAPDPGRPGDPSTRWRFSSDRALVLVGAGTADTHDAIHQALIESGRPRAQAVLMPIAAPLRHEIDESAPEYLLLELGRDDGPRVGWPTAVVEIGYELFALLDGLDWPRTQPELEDALVHAGLAADEAVEWIGAAIEEGTLVPDPSS